MSGLLISGLTSPLKFAGTSKNKQFFQRIQLKCPDSSTSAIYVAGMVANRKHGLWFCFDIKSYVKMSLPVSFCFQICVFIDLTVNLKSEIDMKNKRNSKCPPFGSFDIIILPVLSIKNNNKKNPYKNKSLFHYHCFWVQKSRINPPKQFNDNTNQCYFELGKIRHLDLTYFEDFQKCDVQYTTIIKAVWGVRKWRELNSSPNHL